MRYELSDDPIQTPLAPRAEFLEQRSSRRGRLFAGALVASAIAAAAVLATPNEAYAQTAEPNSVSPTAKGIVGGGFLGAEIVMLPMGAAGLKPWWPYLVFGSLGAASGAVGGWAIEQYAAPPAEAELYMLAGGLALVIPTMVLVVNATTRQDYPEEAQPEPTDQQPIPGENGTTTTPPPGDSTTTTVSGPQSDASDRAKPKRTKKAASSGPALTNPSFPALTSVRVAGLDVAIGLPFVSVVPVYTRREMMTFGVEQREELRFTLLNTAF